MDVGRGLGSALKACKGPSKGMMPLQPLCSLLFFIQKNKSERTNSKKRP